VIIVDQIKMIAYQKKLLIIGLCTTIIGKIINNYLIIGIFMKRKKNGSFSLGKLK